MKTTLSLVALSVLGAAASAQQTPIATTGYNFDVIANATSAGAPISSTNMASASTTRTLDGTFNYFAAGYAAIGSNYGLPNGTRTVLSGVDLTTTFQFQPYTSSNALLLTNTATTSLAANTGKLTLGTAASYSALSLLVTGLNGSIGVSYTLNFLDGSSTTGTFTALDNFSGGATVAVSGFGRVGKADTSIGGVMGTSPYMYQVPLAVSATDAAKKLASISFADTDTSTSADHNAAIFALSGTVTSATAPVPEPGTWVALGLGAMAVLRRRKRA